MAKGGVLGNDPFRRGAAAREPKGTPPGETEVDPALVEAPAGQQLVGEDEPAPAAKPVAPRKKKGAKKPAAAKRNRAKDPATVTRAIQEAAPVPEAAEDAPRDAAGGAWSESTGEAGADAWDASRATDAEDWVPEEESGGEPAAAADRDEDEEYFGHEPPAEAPAETFTDDDTAAPETPRDAEPETTAHTGAPSGGMATPLLSQAVTALTVARNIATHTLRSEAVTRLAKVADGVFSAVMTAVGAAGATAVDEYGKDLELARKVAPIADFLYERYWRVTVEGAELIPAGGAILVANHSGAIPVDGYMLHEALRRHRPELSEARWLAEDQIFHAPFLGTLYNRLGAVRASPENALRLLREGRPVITFPEGVHGIRKPFAERYQLKRLGRGGFVKIAIRERAPIVPVAIVGGEEAIPLLAKLPGELLGLPYVPVTVPPLPARWFIRFGQPITVDALPVEAADDLLEVQRVVEKTRQSIEGMLRAILDDRRSVFGG